MDRMSRLTDEELAALRTLTEAASRSPWRSMVEGRDHTSGDSFIMIGSDHDRDEDMYVSRDSILASPADLDFIAAARNYIPRLLEEITRTRSASRRLARRYGESLSSLSSASSAPMARSYRGMGLRLTKSESPFGPRPARRLSEGHRLAIPSLNQTTLKGRRTSALLRSRS